MLHNSSLVSHPHHNLLKALSLQDKMPVLMAKSQIAGCLQGLALHIICSTTNKLLHMWAVYLLLPGSYCHAVTLCCWHVSSHRDVDALWICPGLMVLLPWSMGAGAQITWWLCHDHMVLVPNHVVTLP